jgi:hypothetical protein
MLAICHTVATYHSAIRTVVYSADCTAVYSADCTVPYSCTVVYSADCTVPYSCTVDEVQTVQQCTAVQQIKYRLHSSVQLYSSYRQLHWRWHFVNIVNFQYVTSQCMSLCVKRKTATAPKYHIPVHGCATIFQYTYPSAWLCNDFSIDQ